MSVTVPAPLIEFILLGAENDRRQLQDSPVLGDVWIRFGKQPDAEVDLLIAPYLDQHAGEVAQKIDAALPDEYEGDVAYVQGLVAARLNFVQLMQIVVPATNWWHEKWSAFSPQRPQTKGKGSRAKGATKHQHLVVKAIRAKSKLTSNVQTILDSASAWHSGLDPRGTADPIDRLLTLTGLLCWAGKHHRAGDETRLEQPKDQITYILENITAEAIVAQLKDLLEQMPLRQPEYDANYQPLVYQVSLNRSATPALGKSVAAVKADSARTLFRVDCSNIGWAILDSGIDGTHPAFATKPGGPCRIKASYDFRHFRKIVSMSNLREGIRKQNAAKLLEKNQGLSKAPSPNDAEDALLRLAEDAKCRAPIRWELVEQFIQIDPGIRPHTAHGTHVAGILGANKDAAGGKDERDLINDGLCPDIHLYDFRVLGPELKDTEFAIIAALQFLRYLNDRGRITKIQGANLSLSIPHDIRNFACGRTPVCEECERLVESGVVVVAAAGNHGYKSYETREGIYEGYTAFSITDPGNADSVITVGSTHRFWPHTYGVSFFSSRGPTGDGRLKPDLVAPGERITAPLAEGMWGALDGTSMAAPHVSGAAAMLMARYTELIGQPRRVKQILCDTATDLGRERTFQGSGMLDVLRAFQAI